MTFKGAIDSATGSTFYSSLINSVMIVVLDSVYGNVATAMVNFENHEFQAAYDDSMVYKNFAFKFVNGFSALFYIGVVKGFRLATSGTTTAGTDYCSGAYPGITWENNAMLCKIDLSWQLATLMIVKMVVGNFTETVLPQIIMSVKKWIKKRQ